MSDQLDLIRGTITKLIEGKLSTYEWDDNMSGKCNDSVAEALRRISWQVPDLFPPAKRPAYCSEKGLEFFKLLLEATAGQRS
jgi:hypothetical protein